MDRPSDLPRVDVEKRILRACKTLRAVPDPDKRFQWVGAVWPDTVRSAEEAYGYEETLMPRFRPTPADISDYLTALSWARGMDWLDFRLIWWRSFDISFRHVAARIHRSDETARRWYLESLSKIWHVANNSL
jgi:hypothetical protein